MKQDTCVYIYIYLERERERTHSKFTEQNLKKFLKMGNLGLGGGFSREEFASEADELGDGESEVGPSDSIRISDGGK